MKRRILTVLVLSLAVCCPLYSGSADYIRCFMVCGPFKQTDLDKEVVKNESSLIPQEGKKSAGKEWKVVITGEDYIDFEKILANSDNCVGYAYVRIDSPDEHRVVLHIGSDDGVKVYLNGETVLMNDTPRALKLDEDRVNIILNRGENHLLFKVKDIAGGWALGARITDSEGNVIRNIRLHPSYEEYKSLLLEDCMGRFLNSRTGWEYYIDKDASVKLGDVKGKSRNTALEIAYEMRNGIWLGACKRIGADISAFKGLRLLYRGEGDTNSLEIKFEDKDGSIFGKFIPSKSNPTEWIGVNLMFDDLEYFYGGNRDLNLTDIKIHFAVSRKLGDEGGEGKIVIDSLKPIE
ncbi:MAG: hypothetical protein JXJ19_01705 [Elusimicrobia bacterium]|nr:hypothetical protein [Elusimicrobiota bacterium]